MFLNYNESCPIYFKERTYQAKGTVNNYMWLNCLDNLARIDTGLKSIILSVNLVNESGIFTKETINKYRELGNSDLNKDLVSLVVTGNIATTNKEYVIAVINKLYKEDELFRKFTNCTLSLEREEDKDRTYFVILNNAIKDRIEKSYSYCIEKLKLKGHNTNVLSSNLMLYISIKDTDDVISLPKELDVGVMFRGTIWDGRVRRS